MDLIHKIRIYIFQIVLQLGRNGDVEWISCMDSGMHGWLVASVAGVRICGPWLMARAHTWRGIGDFQTFGEISGDGGLATYMLAKQCWSGAGEEQISAFFTDSVCVWHCIE